MKRRGQPPKVQPRAVETAANSTVSSSASTAEDTPSAELYLQSATLVGQCWFLRRNDGTSDMYQVALWCSDFDHSSEWRTKPKHIAGEKVSLFLISMGHSKQEGRECEKKLGPTYLLIFF